MRYLKFRRMRPSDNRGFLLVEVIIATILIATMVMGVFMVVISGFTSSKSGSVRHRISLETRKVQEELKDYNSAEWTDPTIEGAPGIDGEKWRLAGDPCTVCPDTGTGPDGTCWALDDGDHCATYHIFYLRGDAQDISFQQKYKAQIGYRVTSTAGNDGAKRNVEFNTRWTIPK